MIIREANHVVVLTGAGISVPSGIPDFRSEASGLWTRDDPMVIASLTSFLKTPQKFYDWLRPLLNQQKSALPNSAHLALAELEKSGRLQALLTQNIDGLHQAAGSTNVIELHGGMGSLTCPSCQFSTDTGPYLEPLINHGSLPLCPNCGKVLKPDIVLFEEMLPEKAWFTAEQHCELADAFLVVGSSLSVTPVANLPLYALQHKARLIIITYSHTYLDQRADVVINEDVSHVLPLLVEEVVKGHA